MTGALAGKRAVVTGAGSGIGEAIARRFVTEGASVALLDLDGNQVEVLAAELRTSGTEVVSSCVDVRSEHEVSAAIGKLTTTWGGLDVVVANAGIQLFGSDAPVDELELEIWQRTIDVNVTGVFLTCKHGIRALLASGGGAVICTGSPTGLRGIASRFHAYSASKAAIFGLVRIMAADYAERNIRANVLVPGFTETPLVSQLTLDDNARARQLKRIPMARAGRPEEIAAVAVFLASDEASYVTGAAYVVDGGMTVL